MAQRFGGHKAALPLAACGEREQKEQHKGRGYGISPTARANQSVDSNSLIIWPQSPLRLNQISPLSHQCLWGITPTCDVSSSLRDENLCAIAANESIAWRT